MSCAVLPTYVLRGTAPNTQILDPCEVHNPAVSSYTIHTRATGGFLNTKPHMNISRTANGITNKCAEVRFDVHGTGTPINYNDTGVIQTLTLESSLDERYACAANGRTCSWQPTGPKRNGIQLRNEREEVLASFTYTGLVARQSGPATGNKQKLEGEIVGGLNVEEDAMSTTRETEMAICSALVVVERAKRRAANVGKQASAYRQGVACEPSTASYGGGL